jgi:hypothetical protein
LVAPIAGPLLYGAGPAEALAHQQAADEFCERSGYTPE